MDKKPRVLTGLEVHEVSLVADPANPHARAVLTKSAERINVVRKDSGPVCRICEGVVADEDFYCKHCGAPFYKSAEADDSSADKPTEEAMDKNKQADAEKAAAEKAEAEKVAAEKAAVERAEAEKAAIEKAAVEKANAEVAKANERIAALEKALVAEATVRKTREAKDRVVAKMANVPGDQDELAKTLVTLSDLDADVSKAVEGILEKCSELVKASGALNQLADTKATAETKSVDEKVAALVKAKVEAGMSVEKARAEVWRQNPGLYKAAHQIDGR